MRFTGNEVRISLVAMLADIQSFDLLVKSDTDAHRRLDDQPRDGGGDNHEGSHRHDAGQLSHEKLGTSTEQKAVPSRVRADPVLREQTHAESSQNTANQVHRCGTHGIIHFHLVEENDRGNYDGSGEESDDRRTAHADERARRSYGHEAGETAIE